MRSGSVPCREGFGLGWGPAAAPPQPGFSPARECQFLSWGVRCVRWMFQPATPGLAFLRRVGRSKRRKEGIERRERNGHPGQRRPRSSFTICYSDVLAFRNLHG